MTVEVYDSFEALSSRARDIILKQLSLKKDLLFCAATGGSPTCTYELLAEEYSASPDLFDEVRIIKLDEWGGLPMQHAGTCETYLQKHLLTPLDISADRYISFRSDSPDPQKECERIQQFLDKEGSIDICILGLGMNGHIALNEPAETLMLNCHVAHLTDQSLQHPMISDSEMKPEYGITLGMSDIFCSKLIILLISGSSKKEITKLFLSKEITTWLPASLLWLHPNVICLIDNDAYTSPVH